MINLSSSAVIESAAAPKMRRRHAVHSSAARRVVPRLHIVVLHLLTLEHLRLRLPGIGAREFLDVPLFQLRVLVVVGVLERRVRRAAGTGLATVKQYLVCRPRLGESGPSRS